MLSEIRCDKFIANGSVRSPIAFNNGLNVVLGDNAASNSIGKSTFLLVVDFAFGGNSYVRKAEDVQKNIGTHIIQFAFTFNGVRHYFSRSTADYMSVNVCDSDYNVTKVVSCDEYCAWLKNHYGMQQEGMSFRSAVTRYARVYQKENLNEKRPLEAIKDEPDKDAILALLKLFDKYKDIEAAKEVLDETHKKVKAYQEGIKYDFIPSISGKRERKEKEKELGELKLRRDNISDPGVLAGKSAEDALRVADLKCALQKLRAAYSKLQSRIARITANMSDGQVQFCDDFKEFAVFFPNADLRKLSEVERFHVELSSILREEMEEEKLSAENEAKKIEREIQAVEKELKTYDVPTGISKKILTEFADADRKVHDIENQLENFDKQSHLHTQLAEYRQRYLSLIRNDLFELQSSISNKMKELNDLIYGSNHKAPILALENSSYRFETPDDSGTGTSCKSLVVFDLAILNLTNLPAIIHDSVLLKNIGDEPMEKILKLYASAGKQIFIALDKSDSYSSVAETILVDHAVLKLSNNGCELFGRSWNRVDGVVPEHEG